LHINDIIFNIAFCEKNNQHDSHATDRICLITATVLTGT